VNIKLLTLVRLWDIWILVSLATPQQIDTTRTVLYARPVLYILHLSRCHSLIIRVSVRAGALSPTGYEPSWLSLLHSVSTVFTLCHSESSESSGSFSVLCAYLHSGRNNYSCPFELLSVGNHLCFLRWSALSLSLHVSLICGACWASAPCSAPIWAWCVEIYLHILGHHSFAGERITKLYTSSFSFHTIATATCHTRIT